MYRIKKASVARILAGLGVTLLLFAGVTPVLAGEEDTSTEGEDRRGFGGPDSVENQLEDEAREKNAPIKIGVLQRWFDWKKSLQEKTGLSFGVDYSSVYLLANEDGASGDDDAASGMARFFGSWDLVGRTSGNTGSFVWKVEHRHKYTDLAVSDFGFDLGYLGFFEPSFNNNNTRLTNLYWRQRLLDGRFTVIGGFLDVTDYVDVFALASPWTGFMNFGFMTGTTTVFTPNDATLGIAAGAMLTDSLYVIGGLANAYSDPTDPFEGFDIFANDNEYFTSVELGWTTSQYRFYLDNAHLTFWHVDESDDAGTPGGWGAAFSFVHFVKEKFMPFVRGGYADEGGSLMEKSLSVGLGYQTFAGRDQVGFAFNWGEPNESSFGPGLDDQYSLELFYRLQLAEHFAITPDLQLLIDPALDPEEDQIWVFGIRARIAL